MVGTGIVDSGRRFGADFEKEDPKRINQGGTAGNLSSLKGRRFLLFYILDDP